MPHTGSPRRRRAARIGLLGVALSWPTIACAEELPLLPDEKPQIEKRYTAVLERVQPGYVPPNIPLGDFRLAPAIRTTTVLDDNIFGTDEDRVADLFVRLQPEVELHNQSSRDQISLLARGTIDRHVRRTSEDVADYAITASGLFDLGSTTELRAAARAESNHQSRLSQDIFAVTREPVYYTQQSGAIAVAHDFDRLRVSATAKVARFDWRNGTLPDGSVYDQQPSDNMSYRVGARVSYAQSPSFAWFVSADYNLRNFRTGSLLTPERDSHGYQILGGVTFEPAALMRGSVGVGYIRQNFRLPYYRDLGGLGFNATVQFFPSQLTTVTVKGQRSVLDSGIPRSGGYLSTDATIRVDHEWLRQLILSASAGYQNNKFNNLDRTDDRLSAELTASYRMNRYAALELGYARLDQSSHGTDRYRAFKDNRLTIGLTLRR